MSLSDPIGDMIARIKNCLSYQEIQLKRELEIDVKLLEGRMVFTEN